MSMKKKPHPDFGSLGLIVTHKDEWPRMCLLALTCQSPASMLLQGQMWRSQPVTSGLWTPTWQKCWAQDFKPDFNNKRVIVVATSIYGLNDQACYICRIQGWNRINKSAFSSCFCSFTSLSPLSPTDHSRCQTLSEFFLPAVTKKQSSDCWSFHCNISDYVS